MKTTQPIRSFDDLEKMKKYYLFTHPNKRNYALIIAGLNTALRISDILKLRWEDVYNVDTMDFRQHIDISEKKTGKDTSICINNNLREALYMYMSDKVKKGSAIQELIKQYIFNGQKSPDRPISRVQAFRIISKAAKECNIEHSVSCHSLRKTFGYHAWKQGISPALITSIYNHSSYKVTIRYLCIEQDDRDEAFRNIRL